MTIPSYLFTSMAVKACGGDVYNLCKGRKSGAEKTRDKHIVNCMAAFDSLASITAFVVGILGATAVIGMPPAAAYALIGFSCLITVLWTALIALMCCDDNA